MKPGHVLRPLVKLPRDPNDCWLWQGAVLPTGYGKKQFNGRTELAHRWIWRQLFGPIPKGLIVSHSCDVAACVNPYHLVLMTQADRNRDNVKSVLTSSDVTDARRWHEDAGMPADLIAKKLGVAVSTIKSVLQGRSWRKKGKADGRR